MNFQALEWGDKINPVAKDLMNDLMKVVSVEGSHQTYPSLTPRPPYAVRLPMKSPSNPVYARCLNTMKNGELICC